MAQGITPGEKLYNGKSIVYFRIMECTERGVVVAYQVPLPTCLKFFVILTNEKAKVSYQTFIKELSNPPRIDTVVILQQPISHQTKRRLGYLHYDSIYTWLE